MYHSRESIGACFPEQTPVRCHQIKKEIGCLYPKQIPYFFINRKEKHKYGKSGIIL